MAPYDVHVNTIAPGIFPDVVTSGEERVRQTTQRAEQTVSAGVNPWQGAGRVACG